MNRVELELALRTLPFLDAGADLPEGALAQREEPDPRYLVWHPDLIGKLFRSDARLAHPGSRSFRPLMGERSILWQQGDRHAEYRRVLGTPLRGRRLADHRATIAGAVHAAIDELSPGQRIPIADWTREVALAIMGAIVFGRAEEEVLKPFERWMNRALGSRYRTLAYRYLLRRLPVTGPKLDRLLVARARRAAREYPASLAGQLLAPGSPFADIEDGELRDQLVSLLFAGHETAASTAAWALFWLDRNESVRAGVLAELTGGSGHGSDQGSDHDTDRGSQDGFAADAVPLLQAVVQETLRITPPVPSAGNRVLTEACPHAGRTLAPGTVLTPSIYAAHHRAESFPEPHRFDPARFSSGRVSPDAYFPFGGGTRHCLGAQLGQAEVRMIVAAVLRRTRLRSVNPRAGVPQLRGHTMAPSPKLRMEVLSWREC